MTVFESMVRTPWAKALGWTLFHSLWEGALAALVLLAVLFVVRSPRARYAWACAAMLGVLGAFALTFSLLASGGSDTVATVPRALSHPPMLGNHTLPATPAQFRIQDALPWLAPFWIAGVLLFHLRSMAGWVAARRLRNRGVCRAPDPWPQRLQYLSRRLGVSKPVALLETCLAEVPVVVGYLRPVILAPVGMLAGMPTAQVEAILLHELAHIQRGDYLANLLQTAAEGFLFYHPAIWWISRVIRAERENCCDDLVVEASGDAREYAAALTALEQTRRTANVAALAATGGSLVKRIRRLLYPPEGLAIAPFLSAGILTMAVAGALVAWQAGAPAQNQEPPSTQRKVVSPYTKWLEDDVAYIINDRERATYQSLRTDEERNHFIEQFWLRRDPTPGTPENEFKEEHYRRLAYADRFASTSLLGWKTDRGRIYILFGPPDEIESHPSAQPARDGNPAKSPFEDWMYYHIKDVGNNVMIEFVDETKTGDFKMTKDPNPAGGTLVPHP